MTGGDRRALADREARRRVVQLMLFRVALITFVLGTTALTAPTATGLFTLIAITYLLSLTYAVILRRITDVPRFAIAQYAGDLAVTTALVHLSGGAQSGYTFFYLMSIVGASLVHHRRGAMWVALASLMLFDGVAIAGWLGWLPVPAAQKPLPWELGSSALLQMLFINSAAIVAVAFLAGKLGGQVAQTGAQLISEEQRSAALAAYSADVIRCLSSGLVTVDEAGYIRTFNDAAAEITGQAADGARGRHLRDVLPDVAGLLGRTGVAGDLRREVVTFRRAGQERVLGVSGSPLRNPEERHIGYIVNFQDLTDLRRTEHQLQRAQRLAAVGQMAAGVAHEIRNPLAAISGSIELLRQTPQLDPDSAALMEIVVREVDRLNGLITDLLEYARPRERVPVKLDPVQLLEETVRVFGHDPTRREVTAVLEVAPDARGIEVTADAAQLRQVVWNLLRNAAEAMPGGGTITVTLARHGDGGVDIGVADGGVGMTSEQAEHIFEPFFTTKTRGSGLGLATVHRIVAEHGGQMVVDSAPGQGTRMTVRLPLAGAASAYTPGMVIEERSGPIRGGAR